MTGPPDVELTPQQPCARCGASILAAVTVAIRGDNDELRRVTATVCPHCDRHHPAPEVQGVLAYFAVNEHITHAEIEDAGHVLAEWARYVQAHPPTYTDEDLDNDIEAWRRGDL